MAASLGCWLLVTSIAMLAPKTKTWSTARTANQGRARLRLLRARSRCRRFNRYQALTDMTRAAPTIQDATKTWRSRGRNEVVNTTDSKLVMKATLPHCELCTVYPAGVCIQELAIRIQRALKWAPKV